MTNLNEEFKQTNPLSILAQLILSKKATDDSFNYLTSNSGVHEKIIKGSFDGDNFDEAVFQAGWLPLNGYYIRNNISGPDIFKLECSYMRNFTISVYSCKPIEPDIFNYLPGEKDYRQPQSDEDYINCLHFPSIKDILNVNKREIEFKCNCFSHTSDKLSIIEKRNDAFSVYRLHVSDADIRVYINVYDSAYRPLYSDTTRWISISITVITTKDYPVNYDAVYREIYETICGLVDLNTIELPVSRSNRCEHFTSYIEGRREECKEKIALQRAEKSKPVPPPLQTVTESRTAPHNGPGLWKSICNLFEESK